MAKIKYEDIFDESLIRDIGKLIKHLKMADRLIEKIGNFKEEYLNHNEGDGCCTTRQSD